MAIFFLEWFLNHPSMRYGGYILIGLPLIIFTSSLLSKMEVNKVNSHKLAISFIILSLVIFNLRNINRIIKKSKSIIMIFQIVHISIFQM